VLPEIAVLNVVDWALESVNVVEPVVVI
jgi:hypothetical protein